MTKNIKSEKGSITIYVIVTMLFFTVFIMSIYIMNNRKYVAKRTKEINLWRNFFQNTNKKKTI